MTYSKMTRRISECDSEGKTLDKSQQIKAWKYLKFHKMNFVNFVCMDLTLSCRKHRNPLAYVPKINVLGMDMHTNTSKTFFGSCFTFWKRSPKGFLRHFCTFQAYSNEFCVWKSCLKLYITFNINYKLVCFVRRNASYIYFIKQMVTHSWCVLFGEMHQILI